MTRWIEASISVLACGSCTHLTPHITFAGDTDMVTADLASLSSVTANEIVLAVFEPEELSDGFDGAMQRLQSRVRKLLGRDDLRSIRLLRSEQATIPEGLSFQNFQKAYRQPRLVYACPSCGSGEATSVREETPSGYIRNGGKLTVLAELEVRD